MSIAPVITGYGGPAVRADTLQVIGTNFGFVTSAAMTDTLGNQYECDFIVDRGTSLHLTVPRLLPDGSYTVVLGTRDNIPSANTAPLLVLPSLPVTPPAPGPAFDPIPDPNSLALATVRTRLRLELGDFEETFQASIEGDGQSRRFDLPVEVIETTGLSVTKKLELSPNAVPLAATDYTVDAQAGVVILNLPLEDDAVLTVSGLHFQFFTDPQLDLFIRSAALKHVHSAESLQVYRDENGFKRFLYSNETIDGVPPVEYHLIALLAATEALEVIRTDAAYDIDVTTAEGTSLPRGERFRNIGELIATKQAKYDDLAAKLGVGLGKVEVFTLRRVSRTTGRLVPVYVSREYDDVRTPPLRVFAPRNPGTTGSGFVQADPYAYGGSGQGAGGYP